MQGIDYYNILELPASATLQEIKTAFRRLAHQYHPDKNRNDPYATAQFEIIKEAYEVLSNPSKKAYYLQQRWYDQSINKKNTQTVITPVTILKQLLELDKYVSKIDEYRMDKDGLHAYLRTILSEEIIEKLNAFNEPQINQSIIESSLKSLGHLPYPHQKNFLSGLMKLKTETPVNELNRHLGRAERIHTWNKFQPWLVLLIVIILCFLIYIVSRFDTGI